MEQSKELLLGMLQTVIVFGICYVILEKLVF